MYWKRTSYLHPRKKFVYAMLQKYFTREERTAASSNLNAYVQDTPYFECVEAISALFAAFYGGTSRATEEEKMLVKEFTLNYLQDSNICKCEPFDCYFKQHNILSRKRNKTN